jgi:hypothetical protein
MAYLNANIPATYAQIRREFLYDLQKHHGEVEDCIIFGVSALEGRALLFHAIMENGAVFYRLPISAFIQRGFRPEDVPKPDANIIDTDHSEIPHEHKCAHILALNDGNYAAQPNNRLIWDIPSFTVKKTVPDWKVQTTEWNVEDSGQWITEDTDNFFYEIEEKKHD